MLSFEDGLQVPRVDGHHTDPTSDYSTMADAGGRGRGGFGRGRGDRGRGRGRGRRGGRKDEEKEWYAKSSEQYRPRYLTCGIKGLPSQNLAAS